MILSLITVPSLIKFCFGIQVWAPHSSRDSTRWL